MRTLVSLLTLMATCVALASTPRQLYTYEQCQGSLLPYPDKNIERAPAPDSLKIIMVNHVGRHGARYPAGSTHTVTMHDALMDAKEQGTITDLGLSLLSLTDRIIADSKGRWGALDSLGMAEHRGIARRLFETFPTLFDNAGASALSSYSPRCMMSMYSFTHELDRLNASIEFITTTGHINDALMRPFDVSPEYKEFRDTLPKTGVYERYFEQNSPTTALDRVMGTEYKYKSESHKRDLAIIEYYVVAGCSAMSLPVDAKKYFTLPEYNSLWSCFNLRQYLQRTASDLSQIPALIARPLVQDIIETADAFLSGEVDNAVVLRFGHAETMMPLLSLLRLPGCSYFTDDWDSVAEHWRDFEVVPLASNLQLLFFTSPSGTVYVRADFNEKPVPLIPWKSTIYQPWSEVRAYLASL